MPVEFHSVSIEPPCSHRNCRHKSFAPRHDYATRRAASKAARFCRTTRRLFIARTAKACRRIVRVRHLRTGSETALIADGAGESHLERHLLLVVGGTTRIRHLEVKLYAVWLIRMRMRQIITCEEGFCVGVSTDC